MRRGPGPRQLGPDRGGADARAADQVEDRAEGVVRGEEGAERDRVRGGGRLALGGGGLEPHPRVRHGVYGRTKQSMQARIPRSLSEFLFRQNLEDA